ncbi:hypothetical protein ACOMHN_060734 [Nucella lapillus]
MQAVVVLSLLMCVAAVPMRRSPNSDLEGISLLKRFLGQKYLPNCEDEEERFEWIEESEERSFNTDPQQVRRSRRLCVQNDRGDSILESDMRDLHTALQQTGDTTTMQRSSEEDRDDGQSVMDNACKRLSQLLPGVVPLKLLTHEIQRLDENGDEALDVTELDDFLMILEILKHCWKQINPEFTLDNYVVI